MRNSAFRSEAAPGFRDLDLALGYDSADEALRRFYVPVLSRAVNYDRSVGYFRASALAAAARGVSRFIAGGGTMRLLIGAEVGEAERDAFIGATDVPSSFAARLADELVPEGEIAERRFQVLAWMVKEERLDVRVAIAVDDAGIPVRAGDAIPYFHEKIGILRDRRRDGVAFQGSVNESSTAWTTNFESFSVYRSWDASAGYFDQWAEKFERRWKGDVPGFRVFQIPEAVRERLLALAPLEPPPFRDVEEQTSDIAPPLLARFLIVAPRLPDAENLAEATTGVTLFPHQRQVVERLASEYPRSWVVADEVGLGKTISAGLALRRLMLAGDVQRALILAPANVCRQWQDELFEKFGLWVPRFEGGRLYGVHPDDVADVAAPINPYTDVPYLLVSSHLARTSSHQNLILSAPSYDLVIVDEAHHARRRGADPDEYRPSRLLQLLDDLNTSSHTRALWLLTATPMQVHAIELLDLLRQVGLDGDLADLTAFDRFFAELAKDDDDIKWTLLAEGLAGAAHDLDAADRGLLDRIQSKLGPVQRERIERFGRVGSDPAAAATELGSVGRRELRTWIRQRGPIGRFVTRHTRDTLRRYHSAGLLQEPVAVRTVQARTITFTNPEQDLYDNLDDLLDRLMAAHGSRRGAGFVLTVYRRRLTSSWEAIRRTLQRRLRRERLLLDSDDLLDEAEDELDAGSGAAIDDSQVVPLSNRDLAEIDGYLAELDRVSDSKFDQLTRDLDEARGSGRVVLVFTQFSDTLEYLRDRLHPAYRSHLATFSGGGGKQWLEDQGWVGVSKQDLVEALSSGRVSVLLATDAASEGLNLQVANYLINFDLPWNPMRVEQRIGRIDRVGQQAPVVTVCNYVIPGTVEESVYTALAARIDLFAGLVGKLQPILGATEDAFRAVFRAPRSERRQVQQETIQGLLATVDTLQRSGIDLELEDPLPVPGNISAPITLEQLTRCLVEDLDIALDRPGQPATADPRRASRDPERWTALATYGHPDLLPALEERSSDERLFAASPLVIARGGHRSVAFRSDRTPPVPVSSVSELRDLGAPLAAHEAEALAREQAEHVDRDFMERERRANARRRERWEGQIRRRFFELVRQAVTAELVIRARAGSGQIEPRLIWLDLTGDASTGWRNGENFRLHLNLELGELLADVVSDTTDDRSDSILRAERFRTGAALDAMVRDWLAVTGGLQHSGN